MPKLVLLPPSIRASMIWSRMSHDLPVMTRPGSTTEFCVRSTHNHSPSTTVWTSSVEPRLPPPMQYVTADKLDYSPTEADPIMAEIAWRTPLGEERRILDTRLFSISADEMKRRFWTKDEIADWVEANCREDMLVAMQGTPPAHGWSFCPVHPDDLAPFQAWVAQPKRHVVLINMEDPTCEPLLREWMARHTTGAWEGVTLLTGPGKHILRLTIRREQDAVFTRLRWSEPVTAEELREAVAD